MGIVFKISLVYTDKPVRVVIQKYHCLAKYIFVYFRNLEIQVEALAFISGDLYVHVEAFASLPPPSYAPDGARECDVTEALSVITFTIRRPRMKFIRVRSIYEWDLI